VDKGGTLLMQNSIARDDVVCNGCGHPPLPSSAVPPLQPAAVPSTS